MAQKRIAGLQVYDIVCAAGLFLLTAFVFGWRLGTPSTVVFDESYYVPAGQAFFGLEGWLNNSHPPLAKWLIGLSSYFFGDTASGWRMIGLIMGCLTVVSVYGSLRLFDIERPYAVLAGLLTILNQTLLVQIRTAMLDGYSLAFFALSVWALIWSAKRRRTKNEASLGLLVSGIFLGCSAASKWAGGMNMALVWGGLLIWRCFEASPKGVFLPRLFGSGFAGWNKLSFIGAGFRQGIPAILVYVLSFAPFIFMSGDWSIIKLHERMLSDVAGNLAPHPYQSSWWEWPLMLEPIWYYFQAIRDAAGNETGKSSAVFLIGNPAIFWGGLPVIAGCVGYGVKREDGVLLAVSSAYLAFWLLYAIIPREIMFSYYYEPAALMLGIAIAVFIARVIPVVHRPLVSTVWLIAAVGLFVFFYPALTAIPFEGSEWTRWIWFRFWT